ncbi:MAG: metallopeptidase TldD-related protein [Desulfobacterales bacterium]|nr:metallopeptidase TldD-related protein [Desulfobacterales bacterium]
MSQAGVTPFLTRIGNRVLPESFTVKDTPSMTRFGALPVGGAYAVDDEGVLAQDVTLVEGGRLRTLLTSRTPQRNLAGLERARRAAAGRRLACSRSSAPTRSRRSS